MAKESKGMTLATPKWMKVGGYKNSQWFVTSNEWILYDTLAMRFYRYASRRQSRPYLNNRLITYCYRVWLKSLVSIMTWISHIFMSCRPLMLAKGIRVRSPQPQVSLCLSFNFLWQTGYGNKFLNGATLGQ